MKIKTIHLTSVVLRFTFLVFLLTSLVNAQEINKKQTLVEKQTKITNSQTAAIPNSPQVIGGNVNIKDNEGNTLILITDEGTHGSITIPDSVAAPGTTTNKLYNVGGTLNFNGSSLGGGDATAINNLTDAKYDGSSLFIGEGTGANDDGTTNNNTAIGKNALSSNITGFSNTANGSYALYSNTTGYENTANGFNALSSNTTGYSNTANGFNALQSNTTGYRNTANGYRVLQSNTTGSSNTANGFYALKSNTTGFNNTANGFYALYSNTTGNSNTANGFYALRSNTTGVQNTANGYFTLYLNTTGQYNTANGFNALYSNTTGQYNTANGLNTLKSNTTGQFNTANGSYALYSNTSGFYNAASGAFANYYNQAGSRNTIIGYDAGKGSSLHSKSGNVFLGYKAGYYETTDNKLYIQNDSSTSPLIWGDFANDSVKINGHFEVTNKTKTPLLQVTTGATDGYVLTSDAAGNATWQEVGSGTTFSIGDTYQGGIIFWLDGSGKHGLIAAPTDQSSSSKWNNGPNDPNAYMRGINAGQVNTKLIVNHMSSTPSFAAKLCDDLVIDTYDDWFLPSLDETILMMTNLFVDGMGSFSDGSYYWTSNQREEFVSDYAYSVKLDNSLTPPRPVTKNISNMGNNLSLRAIRSF